MPDMDDESAMQALRSLFTVALALELAGWIMVSFGCGSMLGSWLGGKLSDKIGFYKIMIFSLFTSGLMFFGLSNILHNMNRY